MRPGDTLKLVERRRGESEPAPDTLSLSRTLWLRFEGGGYSIQDRITGSLHSGWRLEMAEPIVLGRVAVDGRDQLITRLAGGNRAGVELRQRDVDVTADAELAGPVGALPAVGWDHDFHSVSGTLHLPPGWRLLHASGVDQARTTWVGRWELLDVFLVLMIALAVFYLWGLRWGLLALATLALCYHEELAPQWVWLAVFAGEALTRVLPERGRLLVMVRAYRLATWIVLAGLAIPFMVLQVRVGLYPAQEYPWRSLQVGSPPAAPPPSESYRAEAEEYDEAGDHAAGVGGIAQIQLDGRQQVFSQKMELRELKVARSSVEPSRPMKKKAKLDLYKLQTEASVQTGPGLPHWSWNTVGLSWSGPVDRGQTLRLVLAPPWLNLLLALVRVLLLALLAACVIGLPRGRFSSLLSGSGPKLAALAVLLAALGAAGAASAATPEEAPDQEVLDELRARLLAPPDCVPACASSPRMRLYASRDLLRLRLALEAAATTAVPLPGSAGQWTPTRVLLDGRPALGLDRSDDGRLWLRLPQGAHEAILEGPLPRRATVGLALPLKPHRVDVEVDGWTLDGVRDGLPEEHLQLTRVASQDDGDATALQADTLPPFLRVERDVSLGLSWEVETRVVRVTPGGAAVVVQVPVIPGESVTTEDVRVVDGRAEVNMPPDEDVVGWRSILTEREALELMAPGGVPWTEVWSLEAAPIWNVRAEGIPTVHGDETAGRQWRPWPGEKVTVRVARPEGVPGRTLTIDSSELTASPGVRATDATLELSVRSSRGGQHAVMVPDGATLRSVTIDGRTHPLRQDGRRVTLPVVPGSQRFRLEWRETRGVSTFTRAPAVDLGTDSVNAVTVVRVPADRWTLAASLSPRVGPAVLFWSTLVVLLLASLVLGRVRLSPLGWHSWFLLGLGLTQSSVWVTLVIAGWLLALAWRAEDAERTRGWFNLRQLLLVGWTLLALGLLLWSIEQGLLGHPDMQIGGNGSSRELLRWYADRADAALPAPGFLSVSIWWYRAAMLLWAAWLVLSVFRWLRWGWQAFSGGALWKARPAPVPVTGTEGDAA